MPEHKMSDLLHLEPDALVAATRAIGVPPPPKVSGAAGRNPFDSTYLGHAAVHCEIHARACAALTAHAETLAAGGAAATAELEAMNESNRTLLTIGG